MNLRQTKFVREYLKLGNATQAAIKAGYSRRTSRMEGSV
jgi:phage terminase small subunit